MTWALRPAALALGLVWLFGFFGLIDLAGIFDFGSDEVDLIHLSISWGSLVTYFIAVPLLALAFRQTSLHDVVGVLVIALASLVAGALISGVAVGDAGPLLLALPLLLTIAVIAGVGTPRSGWRSAFSMPQSVRVWRLVALAAAGVFLWMPYVVHAVRALDELPEDVSVGLNHWPVQVSAGIAVMLAGVVAALVPGRRRLPIVAASLASVSIGSCMAVNADAATATEGGAWGIGCVLWGTVLALASGEPIDRRSQA